MKKHKFLSACLGFAFLFNTTSCFCSNQGEKRVSQIQSNKKIDKEKIKNVITSKSAKVIGGVGAGLLGAVGIYESACHIGYKINVKKIKDRMSKFLIADGDDKATLINVCDLTSEEIAKFSFTDRLEIFKQCFGIVIHKHSITKRVGVVFGTLIQGAETILCRSAEKRLGAHEKRVMGLKGGNCLDYAFLASLWFDKLGIRNHIICVKHKNGHCGFVNMFFDEDEDEGKGKGKWRLFAGLRTRTIINGCFSDIKQNENQNKVVIEPLKNWDGKYLVDLNTIPMEDFLNHPKDSEIKFNGRLGDFTPPLFFI